MLKAQNSAAQAAIQGALNGPDHTHKGLGLSLSKLILNFSPGKKILSHYFSVVWELCCKAEQTLK